MKSKYLTTHEKPEMLALGFEKLFLKMIGNGYPEGYWYNEISQK